jgi:ABC-type branched-subunit amino acid transport system substrate-binding protein
MMRLGAPVPLSGRYANQGRQMAAALTAWGKATGATLQLEDDQSAPRKAVEIFTWLVTNGFDFVLGPYGSDSVRKVALSMRQTVIWNHGAAADDVQHLENVVSVPSPSSQYLVVLARAVAQLRPGAKVAVFLAGGRFAHYAWSGLEQMTRTPKLRISGPFALENFPPPPRLGGKFPPPRGEGRGGGADHFDAVLAIGPLEKEIALFRLLLKRRSSLVLGGVSPGLMNFADLLGDNPDGFVAPVQWHPSLGSEPRLGPPSSEVALQVNNLGLPALDYVGAQAYAAALIASHCHKRNPSDPLQAARRLRTSTFFGDFELHGKTGVQTGHQMRVVQWQSGKQQLLSDTMG